MTASLGRGFQVVIKGALTRGPLTHPLDRASAAYSDWLCAWQCDEHGHDAGCLRYDLQGTGRPFQFPGSREQWESLTDVTDARVLARHLLWAGTTESAWDQDFNIINGDVFRWNWLWPVG